MAGQRVAVDGGAVATPGATPFTGAEAGTWTAGAISYQTYSKLTVNGIPAIHQASCSFSFTGQSSSGVTVTGSETVTLTASPKVMQGGLSSVLVEGDTASGNYGNSLAAQGAGKLTTV